MRPIIYLCFICLHITLLGKAQTVSLSLKNESIKTVFIQINHQTGYEFMYNSQMIEKASPVTVDIKNSPLEDALRECLKNQPLSYKISGKTIILIEKPSPVRSEIKKTAGKNGDEEIQVRDTISGRVTLLDGTGIPNVNIFIKGTNRGTVTDANGYYKLECSLNEKALLFSHVSMVKQEVPVKGRKIINAVMEEATPELEETVVIGYGTTSRKNLSDAVYTIDSKVFKDNPSANVMEIVQGQIPGLMTMMGSGAPGEQPLTILRGVSSIEGNIEPLFVIDNVPMDEYFSINTLNPNDIYSIDILKGASAMAIYGSRGAGGVFMITTKNGFNTTPSISYRFNYGAVTLTEPMEVLNSNEFKTLWVESYVNRIDDENHVGVNNQFTDITTATLVSQNLYKQYIEDGTWGEAETNWLELLYQPAVTQKHDLTVSGNASNLGYAINLGFTNNGGQVKGSGYKRYNINLKLESRQNKYVHYGVNLSGATQNQDISPVNLASALFMRPDMPAYNEDGTIFEPPASTSSLSGGYKTYVNPLSEIETSDRSSKNLSYTLAGWVKLNIMKGITWNNRASLSDNSSESNTYYGMNTRNGSNNWSTTVPRSGQLTQSVNRSNNIEFESTLEYKNTFNNEHYLDLTAVFDLNRNRSYYHSITINDFPNDNMNAFYQGITPQKPYGSESGSALVSYIFRGIYNYRSKYLATVSFRRDGTSRMAPECRFASFPSLSVAWDIAAEDFMKAYKKTFNMLKLRASWGKVANAAVPAYGWMTTFTSATYNEQPAIIPQQISNDNLVWEQSTQYDLGLDFSLFNYLLTGGFGYYYKMTRGALSSYSLPFSTGLMQTSTMANLIDIDNYGVELDLTANIIKKRDLRWSLSFNIGKNNNKIVRMDADIKRNSAYAKTILKVGYPIGLFYGYETDGLFKSWEEVAYYQGLNPSHNYQMFHMAPGEIKLVDHDGNGWVDHGIVSSTYNESEKRILGKSFPDFFGGFSTYFSWKNLRLTIQGNFSYGAKKNWEVMETQFQFNLYDPINLLKLNLNRWTPSNPDAKYPKMLMYPQNDTRAFGRAKPLTQYFHDYWLYDASYLRINNASLSYSLPRDFLQKHLHFISDLSLSFSVNNLITFTKYPGVNPEAYDRTDRIMGPAVDASAYPKTRTYNFALNLTLLQK